MRAGRVGAGADGRWSMQEMPDSGFELKADLVLLAMGFLGPRRPGMVEQAGVALDPRGNVAANTLDYKTSVPKVFAAGDMRRGQSLVVWAIREGRQCARAIDEFLMGKTDPAALGGDEGVRRLQWTKGLEAHGSIKRIAGC